MKFLVMGCGSIGTRHIASLKALVPQAAIDAFDPQPDRLKKAVQKFHVNPIRDNAIDSTYDCVFICTPPVLHVELAIRALKSGSNVFIEKPLSSDLNGIEKLQGLVKSKQLLAFVGYNLRFNKGVNMVRQMVKNRKFGRILHASAYFGSYLPGWRPGQDYKKSYSARKDLGGGIIYDGSHEIDYMAWLFGRPLSIQSEFVVTDTLSADSEGIADIVLKFQKNILGYIHLDFVRRDWRRALELLCENGIIQWALPDSRIRTFNVRTKLWRTTRVDETLNDMYVKEIRHVMKCLETKSRSEIIDLENGISTLRMCVAVYEAGLSGRRVSPSSTASKN